MKTQDARAALRLLNADIPLSAIARHFPNEWDEVNNRIIDVLKTGKKDGLASFIQSVKEKNDLLQNKIRMNRKNRDFIQSALPEIISTRLTCLALGKLFLSISTGVIKGKIRFNHINGFILQKLLFSHELKRKPVNNVLFRLIWPLITQKNILMPLVSKKGIYCFYSKALLEKMAVMLGTGPVLEIGAGDGALTSSLRDLNVDIRATDIHGWSSITYPDFVEKMDASSALEKYRPRTVICSWPPPANDFEKKVFDTSSVELYVVICSRHRYASCNWEAYRLQNGFSYGEDASLSKLVLPPENDGCVIVFHRKNI